MRRLAERPANIAFLLGNVDSGIDAGTVSELTLGGYMEKHDRAAAFGGSDGQAYSVAIYVDDEPDARAVRRVAALRSLVAGGRATDRTRRDRSARLGAHPGGGRRRIAAALALRRQGRARRGDRPGARGVVSGLLGTVLERDGSVYRVATADGEIRAVLRGKVKREVAAPGGRRPRPPGVRSRRMSCTASTLIEPRTTLLERRVPEGRGARPMAANIDQVFVVTVLHPSRPDSPAHRSPPGRRRSERDRRGGGGEQGGSRFRPAVAERLRRVGYPVYST